jgi:hypothetical protein
MIRCPLCIVQQVRCKVRSLRAGLPNSPPYPHISIHSFFHYKYRLQRSKKTKKDITYRIFRHTIFSRPRLNLGRELDRAPLPSRVAVHGCGDDLVLRRLAELVCANAHHPRSLRVAHQREFLGWAGGDLGGYAAHHVVGADDGSVGVDVGWVLVVFFVRLVRCRVFSGFAVIRWKTLLLLSSRERRGGAF